MFLGFMYSLFFEGVMEFFLVNSLLIFMKEVLQYFYKFKNLVEKVVLIMCKYSLVDVDYFIINLLVYKLY